MDGTRWDVKSSDRVFSLKILSESVPSGPDESRTWTQPEGLSPSVTGSDWVVDHFEGIHIDFQAGELVSPAHQLYIHFNESHDMIHESVCDNMMLLHIHKIESQVSLKSVHCIYDWW